MFEKAKSTAKFFFSRHKREQVEPSIFKPSQDISTEAWQAELDQISREYSNSIQKLAAMQEQSKQVERTRIELGEAIQDAVASTLEENYKPVKEAINAISVGLGDLSQQIQAQPIKTNDDLPRTGDIYR